MRTTDLTRPTAPLPALLFLTATVTAVLAATARPPTAATLAAWLAAASCLIASNHEERAVGRPWARFSGALSCWVLSATAVHGDAATLLALGFPGGMAVGLFSLPTAPRDLAGRVRLVVDGLLVGLATAMASIAWLSMSVGGFARDIGHAHLQQLLGPMGLAMVIGQAIGGSHLGSRRGRPVMALAGVGMLLVLTSEIDRWVGAAQHAMAGPGRLAAVGFLFVGGAAPLVRRMEAPPPVLSRRPWGSGLVYVALAGAAAASPILMSKSAGTRSAAWASAAVVALLLLSATRQALASHETEVLRTGLEERVACRTAEMAHRAFHDPLTGLANRRLLNQRADELLTGSRTLSLLLIDLDGFKGVNDTHGHGCGDAVLVSLSDRLVEGVRPSDVLGRLGGDEFAVLLPDTTTADAEAVGERLARLLSEPVEVLDKSLSLGASIGVATCLPWEALTAEDLFRNADLAMYEAKRAGRGRTATFHEDLQVAARERLEMQEDLRAALRDGKLHVEYQPIVDLRSGSVAGLEALARWTGKDGVPIGPDRFIPVAEETGVIVDLGRWVLATACAQLAEWHRLGAPSDLYVTVNVSVRQLDLADFAADVLAVLAETGLSAGNLVLELTEGVYLPEARPALEALQRLRQHGVRVALDDFGTGYSSLGYLQRFGVDFLKIDRGFLAEMGTDAGGTLLQAFADLGRGMRLELIAEGVEKHEQIAPLVGIGLHHAQGYGLHRPARPDDLTGLFFSLIPRPRESHGPLPPAAAPARGGDASHPDQPAAWSSSPADVNG